MLKLRMGLTWRVLLFCHAGGVMKLHLLIKKERLALLYNNLNRSVIFINSSEKLFHYQLSGNPSCG